MRSILIPAALLISVAATGAFAADATGAIKAVDAKAMTVTLEDGVVYKLPASVKADSLKVGEKVMVTFDKKGDVNEATAVAAAK